MCVHIDVGHMHTVWVPEEVKRKWTSPGVGVIGINH